MRDEKEMKRDKKISNPQSKEHNLQIRIKPTK
jgi:hypothetical protein